MTMPARYPGAAFMAELEAAGGDFTLLSNTVAGTRRRASPSPPSWPTSAPTVLHALAATGRRRGGRAHALRDP